MKSKNENFTMIILCLIEIVMGVIILINPGGFAKIVIEIIGIMLLIDGIIKIVRYFVNDVFQGLIEQSLARGLMSASLGFVCTFYADWFVNAFPVLSILFGIVILISGFVKIERTVDLIRLKDKYWLISCIGAILSLVFAIVVLKNPFSTTVVLWNFTGIMLIVSAVIDIVSLLVSKIKD